MYQILLPQIKPMAGFNDFHNESFCFYEEINHYLDCSTCDYRATSWLIDPSETEDNALLIAGELLSLLMGYMQVRNEKSIYNHLRINGIRLLNPNFFNVSRNFDEVQIPNFLLEEIWMNNESKKPNNPREINNLKRISFDALLYLSKSEIDVYILLKLMAEKASWYNLYQIYESLESFTTENNYPYLIEVQNGKKIIKVLDPADEKEKFTKPANNFSIVGLSARHGYQTIKKPIKISNCFNLEQSRDFVYNHVRRYLQWKLEEFHKGDLFN
jgi:hypothetical protein